MSAMASWRDGPAKHAISDFIAATCGGNGDEPVPVEERVAVFDNDGTLWCENPVPIQMDFILRRFVEMAEADPSLRERQPFKAAYERDHAWFHQVMVEHYGGDDRNVKTLAGGVLAAYDGVSVEEFEALADAFLHGTQHPTLGRGYLQCAYAPMVELLDVLAANGFASYIASGGGRDFMRLYHPRDFRHPAWTRDRQRERARVRHRRARRRDHPQCRDPAGLPLDEVRAIRDDIARRVNELVPPPRPMRATLVSGAGCPLGA
jgi:hypothetical protein